MAQPVHEAQREQRVRLVLWALQVSQALWVQLAPWVPPALMVRRAPWGLLVRQVHEALLATKARLVLGAQLAQLVLGGLLVQLALGVRLVRRVILDTPEIPATGVRLVRKATPAIQVQPVLWVTLELLVFTAKSVSQFLLSS